MQLRSLCLRVLPVMFLVVGCAAPTNQSDFVAGEHPSPISSLPESAPPASVPPSPGLVGPTAPAASSSAEAPAHTNVLPVGKISGNMGVVDQRGDGTELRLSAEIDGAPGWVVVQADRNGGPGKVMGLVHRNDGVHDDVVVVRLRPRAASGRLWVTLYLDRGRKGVFEDPGPDKPLLFAGQALRRSLTLTVTS
jgi:hypothetical protein